MNTFQTDTYIACPNCGHHILAYKGKPEVCTTVICSECQWGVTITMQEEATGYWLELLHNDVPGTIEFNRTDFAIQMGGQKFRIGWVNGEWQLWPYDGTEARRISDPVALALLNLPVFDLVKGDGEVVEVDREAAES